MNQGSIRKSNYMKKESSTFGLSLKKVVKLLNIGSDVSAIPSDTGQEKAELLSDRLSETLPLYYSTEERSSKKLKRLRQTIGILAGEPIGKLLKDSKTDITVIRMTKDYGRKLSEHAKSEAEHNALSNIFEVLLDGYDKIGTDPYFVLKDFESYYNVQKKIEDFYSNKYLWSKYCIHNIASMGKFSSDIVIQKYVKLIWGLKKCPMNSDILAKLKEEY